MIEGLVRRGTSDDIAAFVDLRVAFLKGEGATADEATIRRDVTAYMERAIPAGNVVFWVGGGDDEVVATGAMTSACRGTVLRAKATS